MKITNITLAIAIALSAPVASLVTASDAAAWGRHSHYSHSRQHHHHRSYSHKYRGETCWRTNRHTGARFRIC